MCTDTVVRSRYAQDLVRLANYINNGTPKSQLYLLCNCSSPAVNSLYRALVEHLFSEIEEKSDAG